MRAVAINVGANTTAPGFRGPVHPDGTFTFLPIPEEAATAEPVPTYGDLAARLDWEVPAEVHETPVHLDPTFAEYPLCDRYTYGDPHGVKARPLLDLSAGDLVVFYATLSVSAPADWLPPTWGAFLIGQFRLATDPVDGETFAALPPGERAAYAGNAHCKRSTVDARVLLRGDPEGSRLYERVRPLSRPAAGTEPNDILTRLSTDSGRGPWWRRPLRFPAGAAADLRAALASGGGPAWSYQA